MRRKIVITTVTTLLFFSVMGISLQAKENKIHFTAQATTLSKDYGEVWISDGIWHARGMCFQRDVTGDIEGTPWVYGLWNQNLKTGVANGQGTLYFDVVLNVAPEGQLEFEGTWTAHRRGTEEYGIIVGHGTLNGDPCQVKATWRKPDISIDLLLYDGVIIIH
jgi:hypothetical protein